MRTISERIGSELEMYQLMGDKWANDLKVAMPGTIVSFNSVEQTVTVQPSIKERVIVDQDRTVQSVDLPLLLDVPIVFPRAGGFALTMPVQAGDECLVIFADSCIDAWWSQGGVQVQAEKRRNDLSDGFAILGTWSQPRRISNYSTTSAQLRTEDGSQCIDISQNGIKINGTIMKNGEYDSFKSVDYNLLWSYQMPGKEPVYSSPIIATFSNGTKVLIYQSWDWYIYAHNALTGELLWRKAFGAPNYGRPQAEDVNGDGKIEVFGASHDGTVYCLNEEGDILWTSKNLYDREGSGSVSSATAYSLVDNTKNWVNNSFLNYEGQGSNASIQITSGTGAGQIQEISGVSPPNTLWTFNPWATIPDATSQYKIIPKHDSNTYYQHAGQLSHESDGWYLYVTGFDGQCVKLNASTGSLIWKFSALESNEPYPLVTDIDNDGILEIIFASIDKHVYCLSANTGATKWVTLFPDGLDAFLNADDINNDGIIELLVSCRDNRIYILKGTDGTIIYQSGDTQGDIDTRPVSYDFNGDGLKEIVFGNDFGSVNQLDATAMGKWKYNQGSVINSSCVIGDVNYDGNMEILTADMSGTISILSGYGNMIKSIFVKGGIEGVPLLVDIDNDNKLELIVPTLDGNIYAFKFM